MVCCVVLRGQKRCVFAGSCNPGTFPLWPRVSSLKFWFSQSRAVPRPSFFFKKWTNSQHPHIGEARRTTGGRRKREHARPLPTRRVAAVPSRCRGFWAALTERRIDYTQLTYTAVREVPPARGNFFFHAFPPSSHL